jgi:dienelactone hydrolase
MGGAAGAAGMGGTEPPPPPGDWGTADPAMPGPFMTVTENDVGPDNAFTMFRPMELTKKHPVITWGNGTGTMPSTYRSMLTHYASHGFVVIASNNTNVAGGTPPYMIQGVDWVLEQNADMASPLYEHIDPDHIGATGHSQGAFAASAAAADPRISVWAPLQGARSVSGQHGPGLLVCGTMDTTVPCSGASTAFDRIDSMPVMYAELKAASHVNWIAGGRMHPYAIATTGWFRVHLMGDTALKPMFYGAMCQLCTDSAWVIEQKMLD